MIDKDLETLRNAAPAGGLDGLETAVWQRIAADAQAARGRTIVLGWQAAALVLVVAGGLALGRQALPPRGGLEAFSLDGVPAPSTLLLGSHT